MKAMILASSQREFIGFHNRRMKKSIIPLIRIASLIEQLRRHDIKDIIIHTKDMHLEIVRYFGNGERYGVSLSYSLEGVNLGGKESSVNLGSAGGMAKVQRKTRFFDNDFIVLSDDPYINLDLRNVISFHKENAAMATIILKKNVDTQSKQNGAIKLDAFRRVSTHRERWCLGESRMNSVDTGIYIFSTRVMDYIPSNQAYDCRSELIPKLVNANEKVLGYESDLESLNIGSMQDYLNVSLALLNRAEYKPSSIKVRDSG